MRREGFWTLLGLSPADQGLYVEILQTAPTDRATLATATGRTLSDVTAGLATLTELRLVRTRDDHAVDVVDPRAALTALVRQRQADLEYAGVEVDELAGRYRGPRRGVAPGQLFEIVEGRDAIVGKLVALLAATETSVDAISTPPYVADLDPEIDQETVALLARGVEFRSMYDSSVLQSGPHVDNIQAMISRGEQARSLPTMTTKLIVFDAEIALMPMEAPTAYAEPQAVVIGPSPVSAALAALFERYWQLGTPVSFGPFGERPARGLQRDRRLLQLLANGMSDAAIGRHLRISDRTLRRRIAQLQLDLVANSRFQLGMIAAQRGLVGATPEQR